MGLAVPHALGRHQKFFAKAETTFGTMVKPVATDAIKVLKSSFKFDQARDARDDARSTRSVLEHITGKKSCSWSFDCYVLPSGALGTAPDCGPAVLKAAFGVETINGSTSAVYTCSASQTALGSLSLHREITEGVSMQSQVGALVESVSLKAEGGKPPILTFEGASADQYDTGRTTLNGALSGGETDIEVDDASAAEVGSVIKIGTSDNSGAGHQVTAVDGTTWTVTPAVSGAQSDEAEVIPFVPSETTAGSPIAGVLGSLTIDATTVKITSFDVVMKNNWGLLDDEAFQETITDGIPGFREVTGSIGIRVRRDYYLYLTKRKDFATRDLVVTLGSASGSKLQIDIDYAEFRFDPMDAEKEVVTAKIPFVALGSSGEDEMTWTWI